MNKSQRVWAALAIAVLLLSLFWARGRLAPAPAALPTVSSAGLPQTSSAGFERAAGPRPFSFPADLGPHPSFQTEWWYYTGNLTTASGRHFGYELTFFRRGLVPPSQQAPRTSDWAANQVYLAHFALTDVSPNQFTAVERLERGAAGLAGAQSSPNYQVWVDDWQAVATGNSTYQLKASSGGKSILLDLVDPRGPVLEGDQGYSQKGPETGSASYYFSQPRLDTRGTIAIDGQAYSVSGLSWMDHEFSTSALSASETGWDWFALQLDDGTDLMLYQIRGQAGRPAWANGTWIPAAGVSQPLAAADFTLSVGSTWKSPHSGAVYPAAWTVAVPTEQLVLSITPYLPDQEMNLSFTYWEGAVHFTGIRAGRPVSGEGYVELTGYAGSLSGQF